MEQFGGSKRGDKQVKAVLERSGMRDFFITMLLLLLVLLIRVSSGQQFYDDEVPSLRCCQDPVCCERAENNWENSPAQEPTPTPFIAPWLFDYQPEER